MILLCITPNISIIMVTQKFYTTRSFVDNKQKEFCLLSTLESLVLQSEQYHPVAQPHLHKGLKCEIKIITSVRPQSTVLAVFSYTTSMGIYQVVAFPGCRAQEPGNKARVPGSQQSMSSWYEHF